MRSISSRQNPIVRTFRELASDPPPDGHRLLLDGVHLVEEARAAGLRIVTAAVSQDGARESEIGALAGALARDGIDVVEVGASVMAAISPVRTPSGIVAIAEREPVNATTICQHRRALVIAAVDVQDPGNVGAILRAAEGLGATGVLVCGGSANPFSWKALRGSMGSALRLPVATGLNASAVLTCAHTFGLRTVASVARDGAAPWDTDWSGRLLLLVGGEGPGLPVDVVAAADARVTISMRPPVESLNVAVAAALLLYEAQRQRAS